MKNNRNTGLAYEKLAVEYLKEQGIEIIFCNYRCSRGEVDIIARENGILIFVEVKYRKDLKYGEPEASVDLKKQRKIRYAAKVFLAEKGLYDIDCRFDVIAIQGNNLKWIKDAF